MILRRRRGSATTISGPSAAKPAIVEHTQGAETNPLNAPKKSVHRQIIALYVLLVVCLVASVGTAVTYSRDKNLFLERGTRPVTGTVVSERSGPFAVWNNLNVTYEVNGVAYRETIPVKGNGFTLGLRLAPYFYKPGHRVELLVLASQPRAVRTRVRWTPAWYEWGAVAATSLLSALVIGVLVLVFRRRLRSAGGAEKS